VKRILIAAVLALGVHAMLLGAEFRWLKRPAADRPRPRVMTVSLALQPHRSPIPKTAVKKQEIPLKTPDHPPPVKKRLKKHIPKPKPPTTVKAPPLPAPEKEHSAAAIEQTVDSSEFPSEPQPAESTTTSQAIEQSSKDANVVEFTRKATPLYRTNPPPDYPRMARRRGYQGNVVLEVLVGRNGTVGDLRVSKSSGYPVLDRAALDSVKKWTFVPGMQGNERVKMWVKVPIRFELK